MDDYDPEEQYYVARCVELGFVTADGKTQAEALHNIHAVALEGLRVLEGDGKLLPTPLCRRKYGGKVLLRLTPDKHKELAEEADRRGMSMNDYIASKL